MERIHVTVRARPLSSEDAKTTPWRISGNSILYSNQPSKFEFDQIFGQDCKTREVYEARTRDIVGAAVRGFNGTVFAYGQTNSGKTHTMRGSLSEPGVIPLSVQDLFDIIQEETGREFLLRMSYMEIYNEEINDLLAPEHRKLQIHESIERGIYVAGLREEIVASPEQVLELMQSGESHRHIGETNMNLYSSRSHTIFRMIIESRERSEDEDAGNSCDAVRVSVLNLVDLAGSERAAKTGAEGVRLKEGSHINKSLMTLGTVIKKLSEGAESQGGHVPYRDSKLTRILQPALGGNANTAIICNITLAQVHADETKSSLQFASRALRVTNCACVNEILTDAALLKRQKKEIEELKAKLQGSHSEHFGEEILNLRNTLLKTELERERIALELEEEKKAQNEREKRLQEQAKKIANLSSMVLYSNRDETCDLPKKKDKRRDTWCFGKYSRDALGELNLTVGAKDSAAKPMRSESDAGLLFPFEELVNEANMDNCSKPEEKRISITEEDFNLPNPSALLHVTSRRKGPPRKKSLPAENTKFDELQAAYEDLLLNYEAQRTMSEIQVDFLTRKLAATESCLDEKAKACVTHYLDESIVHEEESKDSRESEAILVIKQLQEKINNIELEKCSSQKNLDSVVELATEQNLCAIEKYEKIYNELLDAREEARKACEQLTSIDYDGLSMEVEDLTSEVKKSRSLFGSVSLVVDELWQSLSASLNSFSEFKHLASSNSSKLKSIISDHEKLQSYMLHKVNDLEHEKLLLHNQCLDLHRQIQELNLNYQQLQKTSSEFSEQHELETEELLAHIQSLEKEISCLSSSSLAREKEGLRKELDKTKSKLRETDSKLKNVIQEKTKLEGEKASAERELKKLHSQTALLQRDISKRESLAGKRCDSVFDRSKGLSSPCDQNFQEEYKKLEVIAFEMETYVASLEEQLTSATEENQVAMSKIASLSADLEDLSTQLSTSNSELNALQEEKSRLEESLSLNQTIESSIQVLVEEKEELAMQLAEALLGIEEEKAIWSSKEKASLEAIEDRTKSHNSEIVLLRERISEVTRELASTREECRHLGERLICTENNVETEKECSLEKVLEIERLQNELEVIKDQSTRSQETLKTKLQILSSENHQASKEVEMLCLELSVLKKERNDLQNQVLQLEKKTVPTDESELLKAKAELEELSGRLSSLELKTHNEQVKCVNDKAKLRMMVRGTKATCDAFEFRCKETVQEIGVMDKKYEEAVRELKSQLASYIKEVLYLRKQLANLNTTQ